jgi:hypothetical protein
VTYYPSSFAVSLGPEFDSPVPGCVWVRSAVSGAERQGMTTEGSEDDALQQTSMNWADEKGR